MPKPKHLPMLAALAASLIAVPAAAETLRCRSVNGNTTCAGSGAVSCQTIDGRTTCTSGGGGVVQQFGSKAPKNPPSATPVPSPDADDEDEAAPEAGTIPPRPRAGGGGGANRLSIERRGPGGAWLSLEREGARLRLRTERLAVDLD
jgi:hypothetical protein